MAKLNKTEQAIGNINSCISQHNIALRNGLYKNCIHYLKLAIDELQRIKD